MQQWNPEWGATTEMDQDQPIPEVGPELRVHRSYLESIADPLDGGMAVSLEEARRRTPYEIPLPAHSAANSENLRQVFISPAAHVAQVFQTDILIILQRPDFADPAAEFAGLVASGSVNGRVETIQGEPALVIDPDSDSVRANPASIQFVWRGISVTLYADHLTAEQLKEVAETVGRG